MAPPRHSAASSPPPVRTAVSSLRLGHIAGVEIRVDWSLLIVFALIVVNLGAGVFPNWHPDWPGWFSWAVAVAAAALFFASVLVHELSHAVVGRAQGIPVPRITLFLFGGVAHMEGEPRSPKGEFWMAIVGPLTSIAIGVTATVAGALLAGLAIAPFERPERALQQLGPVSTLLLWLGPINIALGVFNMIPGFPLDGGRVLRALLWGVTGDFMKATRWAAGLGQVFAYVLMGIGAVNLFGGAPLQGLWLLLIGWFLNNAARASQQQVILGHALAGVSVTHVMRTSLARVGPETTVEFAVRNIFLVSDQDSIPVEEDGRLVGLVSLADIRALPQERWPEVSVADIMTRAEQLTTLPPDAGAEQALKQLRDKNNDQIPVVDRGRMLGVVAGRDLVKWLSLRGGMDAPSDLGRRSAESSPAS